MNPELEQRIRVELLNSSMVGGVYIEDLADGDVLAINSDMVFPGASIIKIPIAVHILAMIAEGRLNLEDTVELNLSLPEYQQPMGSGVITNMTSHLRLNIRDLLMLSLAESDNLATNELLKFTSMSAVNTTLERLGLRKTRVTIPIHNFDLLCEITSNPVTANELGFLYRELFYQRLPNSDLLLELLALQKYNTRIPFFMPEFDDNLRIMHKTGSVGTFIHDAGIVMHPNFNYIIVLLSQDGPSWLVSSLTLARISNLVYQFMAHKYVGAAVSQMR